MPGVEHAPAALAGRRLQCAALADSSPIGRDKVDVHAESLQQFGGDVALSLGDAAGRIADDGEGVRDAAQSFQALFQFGARLIGPFE